MPLSWLPLGQIRASASSRAAALESARIDDLRSPEGVITFIAGGRQTKGALPVKTAAFEGAVYSSRGRGYARYNEDAAMLFTDANGRAYAAAFDQAGGLGGRVRGAASEVAARSVFGAFHVIATSRTKLDEGTLISEALARAHDELVARGEGEVTTAVAALFRAGTALVINSGDSGALHYDRRGRLKGRTTMHEHESPIATGCLTHGIGLIPESPAPDTYRWALEQGDWVLLCTDGLLDAGLTEEAIGAFVEGADSAEAAVNRICTRVLRLMTLLRAKPDNLSIVAVRAI